MFGPIAIMESFGVFVWAVNMDPLGSDPVSGNLYSAQ